MAQYLKTKRNLSIFQWQVSTNSHLKFWQFIELGIERRHLSSNMWNRIECRYNAVQYSMTLYTALQWWRENIDQSLYTQKTTHSSPSRASYGMSIVRISVCLTNFGTHQPEGPIKHLVWQFIESCQSWIWHGNLLKFNNIFYRPTGSIWVSRIHVDMICTVLYEKNMENWRTREKNDRLGFWRKSTTL